MLHEYIPPTTQIMEIETEQLLQTISGDSTPIMINVYDNSEDEKYSVKDAL